jgi:very-short-patch-repair endonuclease
MPQGDRIRAADLSGPFRGSLAIAEKAVSRAQLRTALFVPLFRDVFLPAAIPITHELRCRAAWLVAPQNAVLTGHSAASSYGIELARPQDPVELLIPEGDQFRPHPGMNVRYVPIRSDEYEVIYDRRVATPQRMALDLLLNPKLRKTLAQAVAALDAVAHKGIVDLGELRDVVAHRHDHGIVRARDAVALADARAESVPESVLRVLLLRSGIAVTPQVEVWHRNRFVARVDLAVDGVRLAVEYDGEWHAEPEQARQDEIRRARLAAAGWRVIVVTKDGLYQRPQEIVRAVRIAFFANNAMPVDNFGA